MTPIQVNEAGTIASARTDEGPLMLFDLEKKCHMYNIQDSMYFISKKNYYIYYIC